MAEIAGMVLEFDAQLLAVEDRDFTSTEGSNKGQRYEWTELTFNTVQGKNVVLKTVAPVKVDPASMRRDLHWVLGVEPKDQKGKTFFKVTSISGAKAK